MKSVKRVNIIDFCKRWIDFCYKKDYKKINLILLFFIFAFLGYIYEITVNIVFNNMLVNKGMLHGPIIPIYGIGGILILVLLKKFMNNPLKIFTFSGILCSILEVIASYILDFTVHTKYWDYSSNFLNFQGRTCLLAFFAFGILGLIATYLLAPWFDKLLSKLKLNYRIIINIILCTLLIIDLVLSIIYPKTGIGITY